MFEMYTIEEVVNFFAAIIFGILFFGQGAIYVILTYDYVGPKKHDIAQLHHCKVYQEP